MDKNICISKFLKNFACESTEANVLAFGTFNGCFNIPKDSYSEFIKTYVKSINSNQVFTLVEKPTEISNVVIDIDIKDTELNDNGRLYNNKLIKNVIKCYSKAFTNIDVDIDDLTFYVCEKPEPTKLEGKYKDGFHIFVDGYKFNTKTRVAIYNKANYYLKKLGIFENPEEYNDKAVINSSGWIMYGCGKPKHPAYKVSMIYQDGEYYTEFSESLKSLVKTMSINYNKSKLFTVDESSDDDSNVKFTETEITSQIKKLDIPSNIVERIVDILSDDRASEYDSWFKVGCAIKSYNPNAYNLFDSFSLKSIKNYNKINNRKIWDNIRIKSNGITMGSIFYWAKIDNPVEYNKIISECVPKSEEDIKIDEWYQETKKNIESNWFKLNSPPMFCRIFEGELQYYSYEQAVVFFKSNNLKLNTKPKRTIQFLDMWTSDPTIRTYEKIDFDPSSKNPNIYNMFSGFINDTNAEPECVKEFKDIVEHIFKTKENIHFFYSWLNHILTTPHKRTGIAIILYSNKHGVGKNCLVELVCKLIGQIYVGKLGGIDDIKTRFNSFLCNKLIIYGDEIKMRAKDLASELKNFITEIYRDMEKKGKDRITLRDCSNLLLTTNEEIAFNCEQNDRRMFCVEVDDKRSKEFYQSVWDAMEDTSKLQKFFSWIKQYKNPVAMVGENIPLTDYKLRIIGFSLDAVSSYFYKNIDSYSGESYQSISLYNEVIRYAKENHLTSTFTTTYFGKILSNIMDISDGKIKKMKTRNGNTYVFPERDIMLNILKQYNEKLYIQLGMDEYEAGTDVIESKSDNKKYFDY